MAPWGNVWLWMRATCRPPVPRLRHKVTTLLRCRPVFLLGPVALSTFMGSSILPVKCCHNNQMQSPRPLPSVSLPIHHHNDTSCCLRAEVFTAVTMTNGVFWYVTSCGCCKNRRFGGRYHLHHQGGKDPRARTTLTVTSN
jgi:hypothetical protein